MDETLAARPRPSRWPRKWMAKARAQHSGLGLSIMAACATALGARCDAKLSGDGTGKILTIEVTFDKHTTSSSSHDASAA